MYTLWRSYLTMFWKPLQDFQRLGQWDTGSLGSPGLIVWGIRQHLKVLTLRHFSASGTSPTSAPVGPEAPVISTINRKLQKVTWSTPSRAESKSAYGVSCLGHLEKAGKGPVFMWDVTRSLISVCDCLYCCVSLCISVSSVDRRSRSKMGGGVSSSQTQLIRMLKYFREGFVGDDGYIDQHLL